MTREPRREVALSFLIALAVAATGGCAAEAPRFSDEPLDEFIVTVDPYPSYLTFLGALTSRPDAPVVMVNLLSFKEWATGDDYEGLTGAEAYEVYGRSMGDDQIAVGTRSIWTGAVQAHVVGESDPPFDAVALFEYRDPGAFLEFGLLSEGGGYLEARYAGLEGQWLIASTTTEEGTPASFPPNGTPPPLPELSSLVADTGLSRSQIERLLDGPADEPVYIAELLRFRDEDRTTYDEYVAAATPAMTEMGAQLVWRGSLDQMLMGAADPEFDEFVVVAYPSRAAYLRALSDPRTSAALPLLSAGLSGYWLFTLRDSVVELPF